MGISYRVLDASSSRLGRIGEPVRPDSAGLRVLHVYKNYLPETRGGVEQVIFDLCEGAAANGLHAEVAVTAPVRTQEVLDVAVHRVNRFRRTLEAFSTPVSIEMLMSLPKLAESFDLLHYHFPWPFMDLLQERMAARIPYVVTYHSDIVRQKALLGLYSPLMRRFLTSASCVVATSERYRETSLTLQRLGDRVAVVPIGIQPPPVPRPGQRPTSGAVAETLKDPSPYLLFVGVLRYYKGLEYLVRAAAALAIRVVVAGDGPDRSRIEGLIRETGVRNVRLLGRVEEADKWLLLHNAAGFVFPSHLRSEAFGISLLEAAAFGKPLICCELGSGTSFINLHGETGFVVPPADPRALAKAMRKIEADPSLAVAMGKRAKARFETHFTADRMSASYLDIYRTVAHDTAPGAVRRS